MTTQRIFTTFSGWPLRLACLGLSLAPLAPAFAVDGTITINGEIIDQTCKINGSTPPANLLVTLPKIGNTALKSKGDTAGATPFILTLTDCPSSLSGEVRAYFEPGLTTDYDTGNLIAYQTETAATLETKLPSAPGTPKTGVQIQLANPDGKALTMGASASVQAAQGATLQASSSTKTATLRYLARYVKTGTSTIAAGKVKSYVTYSIIYP
ncbi:fimbrial protein [Bordetella trematum]|uniref:fimbrial protein n=1 Tax=Bordetella trematum TaxID=123899 RepID=UPI003989E5DE